MNQRTFILAALCGAAAQAQLIDATKAPNTAGEGIHKSLSQQIGAGRGDIYTPDSSLYLIRRDPFRSIRRGRQLFQRKFTRHEGQGPTIGDGSGDINTILGIGAGLADSCAGCHGRPRGSAGFGGDVVTRPDSRDAPHLFGLGLKEMLADEITTALRAQRSAAGAAARLSGRSSTVRLTAKGIEYGFLTANPDGSFDTTRVQGVDPDLRVRPFFHHGGTISIREFVAGALHGEMGMEAVDADLMRASRGGRIVTPSGMVLDGSLDSIEAPPTDDPNADPDGDGVKNEVPAALVDHLEFYLLNYFKPGRDEQNTATRLGRHVFDRTGCASCHIPDLLIEHDRRVADVETAHDPARGIFNQLFATAAPLFRTVSDGRGPDLKLPALGTFLVRNIFTDFKRHDLGPYFHERNYDGTTRTHLMTTALWGVGSTAPYGHDGRSMTLKQVILRHGGEAQHSRDEYARLNEIEREALLHFLNSLVLFPPDDTASTLDPGNPAAPGFPQKGHGAVKLTVLFNNPADVE
ncbi:MAG: thiol oxidoreductase-like protein [Acidobacteria bacterium]|nr:thiol oxidoreductase-like protein [Acidobacteriota bacterium]